jgi:hypothetical protein
MLIKNASGSYGTGPRMAVNPRYLLVPRALQLTGMKILYPSLENAASIYSENMQRGQPGDVITVPEWTDATNWAAVCDPRVAPAVFIGERFGIMPEIFLAGDELSPAVFTHDGTAEGAPFSGVWVNDFAAAQVERGGVSPVKDPSGLESPPPPSRRGAKKKSPYLRGRKNQMKEEKCIN